MDRNHPGQACAQGFAVYFYAWRDTGVKTINHLMFMAVREAAGREASPSAGVIDSQSVKTTEAGGPSGYDAGKKIKGRKRHILTDTLGLLVAAIVPSADSSSGSLAASRLAESAPPSVVNPESASGWG